MSITKETRHGTIIVDECDADLLERIHTLKHPNETAYAQTYFGKVGDKYIMTLTHRVILERMLGRTLSKNEQVDHRDGNGLNNQRHNLRLASGKDNQGNKRLSRNNTTGLKGVRLQKRTGKWEAQIKKAGRVTYLGTFTDPADAHAAYMDAALEYFGEFANSGEKS